MILHLTHFDKKPNSTDVPTWTGTTYRSITCLLKGPTSVINPVLILDRAGFDTLQAAFSSSFNYARIPNTPAVQDVYPAGISFAGRCYFIDDIVYDNAVVELHLSVDVLGSWRSNIFSSSQYVLRSASKYDTSVMDVYYPAKAENDVVYIGTSDAWISTYSSGMIIVGIIGTGKTLYAAFSPDDFDRFLQYIMSPTFAASIISQMGLSAYPQYRMLVNPLQYISSCMWIPIAYTSATQFTTLVVGNVSINLSSDVGCQNQVYVVDPPIYTQTDSWILSKHPQTSTHGEYTNYSPWTRYFLEYAPFGLLELDGSVINNTVDRGSDLSHPTTTIIESVVNIDVRTGTATMYIYKYLSTWNGSAYAESERALLSKVNAQLSVTLQMGQVLAPGFGVASAISSTANIVSNLLSGNVAGLISNTAGAIGDAVKSQIPSATSIGSTGGVDALQGKKRILEVFNYAVDNDVSQHGKPLCSVETLSTLSGYTVCFDAEGSFADTKTENQEIIDYLNGGVFLE